MEDKYVPDIESYTQAELFWKESNKEYVKMSDGAELFCYYTKKNEDSDKPTLIFNPGFATGVFCWTDLWDHLYKDYNLYVFESREKNSSKVKWGHKGNFNRLGLDLKEFLEHYEFDQSKIVFFSSSFGCSTIARALAENWIAPAGHIMNGPALKFILPRNVLWLAYILPTPILKLIGIPILKLWINIIIPKGFQRLHYHSFIDDASPMRWKKTLSTSRWDASEDYAKIKCPTWVIKDPKDKMHKKEFIEIIKGLIPHANIIDIPEYHYMHHNPGAKEFAQTLKETIKQMVST